MEFKQLEIKQESGWFKRTIRSKHTIRSIIYTVIGAIAGLIYFFLTKGKHVDIIVTGDIIKSMLVGGFIGFFITNSPCARNKC
ncbi:MAG: hypothetical protein KOO66_08810 [Bacteroidales bacterium]|nr:hypothetical protein [Bacteroidales bacterium]